MENAFGGKPGPVMGQSTGPCRVSCCLQDCMKEETQLRTESLKGTPESAAKPLAECRRDPSLFSCPLALRSFPAGQRGFVYLMFCVDWGGKREGEEALSSVSL